MCFFKKKNCLKNQHQVPGALTPVGAGPYTKYAKRSNKKCPNFANE